MTSSSSPTINSEFRLRCGLELKNRIVKAAMTEALGNEYNQATEMHCNLYETWAQGGTGLLITGNVQIDRRFMERPGNASIEPNQSPDALQRYKNWAKSSQVNGCKTIVQISHGGRQSTKLVNTSLVGPSAVVLKEPNPENPTGTCRALTLEEIHDVKSRFVNAAKVCEEAGFAGVQLHAAHGYLLSSFLNPLANKRTDAYGGSTENRARLLIETVKEVRQAVQPSFAVTVKINSADFQKGGFTLEDCIQVVQYLDDAGIDMIELSGGNYESPVMLLTKPGERVEKGFQVGGPNESTLRREAYFLEFANAIRKNVNLRAAIMVTGGFRSRDAMNNALKSGDCELIGVGRPLCFDPNCVDKLLSGKIDELPRAERDLTLPWYLYPMYLIEFGKKFEFAVQQASGCYRNLIAMGKKQPLPTWQAIRGLLEVRSWDNNQATNLKGIDCEGVYYQGSKRSKL